MKQNNLGSKNLYLKIIYKTNFKSFAQTKLFLLIIQRNEREILIFGSLANFFFENSGTYESSNTLSPWFEGESRVEDSYNLCNNF